MTNRPQLGYIHLQGLAPSKDSFWSTSAQPGSPYDGTEFAEEPFPELQAAVTSLSAGPVAPSDGVDYADAALILRCCRADGAAAAYHEYARTGQPHAAVGCARAQGAGEGEGGATLRLRY